MKRRDRRWIRNLGGAALVLAAIAAAGAYYVLRAGEPIRIALLAPLSGEYAASGESMLAGARLRAERINAEGGIHDRPVEIVAHDTKADPDTAAAQARDIVAGDAVAVIGPYFSATAVAVAPVLAKARVPGMTGSATAPALVRDNPWYFRIVPDNDVKGRFSALYTDGVLGIRRVSVAYENDAYGRTLAHAYRDKARQLGMTTDHAWSVDSSAPDADAQLDRIADALRGAGAQSALFVALLGHDAAKLVAKLHAAGSQVTVIGGDSVGLDSFRQAFAALDDKRASMAAATRGVYATTYFLADVANQRAQRFIGDFRARYEHPPRPVAATHYDAVGVLAAALDTAGSGGAIAQQRQRLRDALPAFDALERAYRGVTGRLFFDKQGSVIKPSTFGVYDHGRLISAPVQLTPVVHPRAAAHMNTQTTGADTVTLGGRDYYKTDIVYTGVDVNRLDQIDARASRFEADFYLWFRYRDGAAFSPDALIFPNAVAPVSLGEPIARRDRDSQRYVAYRIRAAFNTRFDFHEFPFDTQTLRISLRPKEQQSNRVKLVADDIGMSRSANYPSSAILANSDAWRLQALRVFADVDATESTLGNPALLASGSDAEISYGRLNVVAHIKRLTSSYVLSNLAPLFFVLVLGYAMLFVPVEGPPFTARINLGVLALLTTVSFSLKTSRELPEIGYLVLIDYLYFTVYLLLLYGIGISILKLVWSNRGRVARVHRLDVISRIAMPLFLIAALVLVLGVFR